MVEILLIVAAIAFFGFVLSSPKIMFVISWAAILGITGYFGYISIATPEISFFNAIVGTLIFLCCAGIPYFIARKVMESLWPDMMINGVIGEGKSIFVARFWAGLWSFLIPVGVSMVIAFMATDAYYKKMVDGYQMIAAFSEKSSTITSDTK
jgi:hypothetical protein